MPEPPSPAILLFLADIGPRDETRSAVKRCRKRVTRLRENLAPSPRKVVNLGELEPVRAEALRALKGRCAICGQCVFRADL